MRTFASKSSSTDYAAAGVELARALSRIARCGVGVENERRRSGLRIVASDPRREARRVFAKQFAPLITSGPRAWPAMPRAGRKCGRCSPTGRRCAEAAGQASRRSAHCQGMENAYVMTASNHPTRRDAHSRKRRQGQPRQYRRRRATPAGYDCSSPVSYSAERSRRVFSQLGGDRIEASFELPRVRALNFVLYNALAGGAVVRYGPTRKASYSAHSSSKSVCRARITSSTCTRSQDTDPKRKRGKSRIEALHFLACAIGLVFCNTTMPVDVKVHEAAGTIILNRPEKRNALSREMLAQLAQAFDDLHGERRVRAVILTGAGPAFCAGMDLAEMLETSKQQDAQARWHEDAVAYRDLIEKMLRFPKPIIAAVNGPAMAGGAGLVLASDIVVAGKSARIRPA